MRSFLNNSVQKKTGKKRKWEKQELRKGCGREKKGRGGEKGRLLAWRGRTL